MGTKQQSLWGCLLLGVFSTLLFQRPILAQEAQTGPVVVSEVKHDLSPPLRDMVTLAQPATGTPRQAPVPLPTRPNITTSRPDMVAQPLTVPLSEVSVVLNFNGQSAADTLNLLGFAFVPPDTNGAVGATQFVQIVNVTFAVYEKRTGTRELGPALIHTIWKGFGGQCAADDGGDPIVLYDHLAGRWLISQFQFTSLPFLQCVAISKTSDAAGSYHRYAFAFGSDFPDYPKFGVWPDAYYYTANIFGHTGFLGARACAFERSAMLDGKSASMICFQEPASVASLLPSDLDGKMLPPTGSPNFFVEIADSMNLNLFKFHVDFDKPANSSFRGPAAIPVAPFSEICNRAITLACIPEPTPGEKVDSLGDRLMFRLAYRNFGDHESLVVNHTIAGGALAGVRWYEIRSPSASPFVFQQGTVVDPNIDFWMGSIAMDKAGDLALGFSGSSVNLKPRVELVGRIPSDPLGVMAGPIVEVAGTGVQKSSFHRWGDYSGMAIDPMDDCTFWYSQEYYQTTGSFNWTTRITAFKFNSCK